MVLMVILSALAAIVGAASLSNATAGVGGLAFACLLAIFARIAQAGTQHAALMKSVAALRSGDAGQTSKPESVTP